MTRKVLVGMLLLGALFIFGVATFYVENWQTYLGRGYTLTAKFPLVQTLDKGDIVRMAGVNVGRVDTLDIDTEAATTLPVEATLWIRRGVNVRADDTATVRLASLFGGSYVAIERGDPAAPVLGEGQRIEKTDVAASATEIIEQSKLTLREVQTAFEDVTAITADLKEGKGALGRMLKDEELYENLDGIAADAREAVDGLKEAADRLERGEGVLGKLVMDDQMAEDLDTLVADAKAITEDLRTVTADLREGEGTLGKLLKTDELHTSLEAAVASISEVADLFKEGEGLGAKLLNDAELADDFRAVAANLKEVSVKLAEGESTLGKLLDSDEAYQKLDASLDDLNEFTSALAEGEGTLGKLVADAEAYDKITKLIDSVQGIVDTYREQSPVVSFAGAIFGAF